MINPYLERLSQTLDGISPGISQQVQRLPELDASVSLAVLNELLACACQSTNAAPLIAGRKMIATLPSSWLEQNLPAAIRTQLNLEDDWEFRRLLELLHFVCPALTASYIQTGLASVNPHVVEAAQDFSAGRYPQILVP